MIFNIEQLVITRGSWRVRGWVIRADAKLASAVLRMTKGKRSFERRISVGVYRSDVEINLQDAGAGSRNGIDGFGAGGFERPDSVELLLRFDDGQVKAIDIGRFQSGLSAAIARVRSRFNAARALLKRGLVGDLVAKAGQALLTDIGLPMSRLLQWPGHRRFPVTGRTRLIVDHAMGGGAMLFGEQLATEGADAQQDVCLLRFSLDTLHYSLEYRSARSTVRIECETTQQVASALASLPIDEVHVNNMVSFPRNNDIIGVIEGIASKGGAPVYFYFHDYYPICPSFTLLNHDGTFCGVPAPDVCADCLLKHNDLFVVSQSVDDIERWRRDWKVLLDLATGIRFFSEASRQLFSRAFPTFDQGKCVVHAHAASNIDRARLGHDTTLTIAVVGSINAAKGAQEVKKLCEYISAQSLPVRVIIIGTIDEQLPFEFVRVTGRYNRRDLPRILEHHGVNVAFFSSIWPETYSFVVSELQQTGVPVVAFDIGAPAERISGSAGKLVPLNAPADVVLAALQAAAVKPDDESVPERPISKVCVFTSAATNYLPKAMLLGRSIKEFHPEIDLVYGLCDSKVEGVDYLAGVFDEVIAAEDLEIPQFEQWSFQHSIVELSTAIKPYLLRRLLARGYEQVYYFDPDIVVFSRLDDLLEAGRGASILLTPHQAAMETEYQSIIDNEIASLKYGVYNLGFVGVSNTQVGRAFASWWADRLYEWCVDDIPNGLFTDQRWIDLVPALFSDVRIERSSRFNVSTWNITQRHVTGGEVEGYKVDGLDLGFYHFTGFDKGDHRIMAAKNSRDNPSVMALVNWYQREIAPATADPLSSARWAFGTYEDGVSIPSWHRRMYRDRKDIQAAFPHPYSRGQATMLRTRLERERKRAKGKVG